MGDWTFAGLGIIVISAPFRLTSIHAVRPQVDISSSPGLRTPETTRSKGAWLAAHTCLQPTLRWTSPAVAAVRIYRVGTRAAKAAQEHS